MLARVVSTSVLLCLQLVGVGAKRRTTTNWQKDHRYKAAGWCRPDQKCTFGDCCALSSSCNTCPMGMHKDNNICAGKGNFRCNERHGQWHNNFSTDPKVCSPGSSCKSGDCCALGTSCNTCPHGMAADNDYCYLKGNFRCLTQEESESRYEEYEEGGVCEDGEECRAGDCCERGRSCDRCPSGHLAVPSSSRCDRLGGFVCLGTSGYERDGYQESRRRGSYDPYSSESRGRYGGHVGYMGFAKSGHASKDGPSKGDKASKEVQRRPRRKHKKSHKGKQSKGDKKKHHNKKHHNKKP